MQFGGALALLGVAVSCDRSTDAPAPEAVGIADATPADWQLLTFQEPHMGTGFTIRIWAETGRIEPAKSAAREAFARVSALEGVFSDYRVDSEIVKLTAHPAGESVPVSPDLLAVLSQSLDLSGETGGAFDVTVGPMVRLWRQSRKDHHLPSPDRIAQARERTGWQKIELDPDSSTVRLRADFMQLDFGGIVKGYAADEALETLRQRGFPRALVAASGDIALGEAPPREAAWKIGIRSLDVALAGEADPAALTGRVPLVNAAISTSGDTRQAVTIEGVRYSHIVDPATALGLSHRIAVTVIGPDAATTDSCATAVCVLGRERGLAYIESKPGMACLILEADDTTGVIAETRSRGFPQTD